jgi:Tfp pilus assembly protein PilF
MTAAAQLLFLLAGVEDAVRDLYGGRPREAEILLQQLLAADPNSAAAWKWLGVTYASQSRYHEAEGPFRAACRLAPKDPDACYFLGRCLYSQNRFEAALPILTGALDTGIKPGRVLLALAQALEALGRSSEAERHFREAAEAARKEQPRPEDHPALHYGIFLLRQARTDDAIQALRRAPASGRAHFELGRAYYQSDRLTAAVDELRQAVERDTSYAPAHLLLGKAYARLGKTVDAERHTAEGEKLVKAHEQQVRDQLPDR